MVLLVLHARLWSHKYANCSFQFACLFIWWKIHDFSVFMNFQNSYAVIFLAFSSWFSRLLQVLWWLGIWIGQVLVHTLYLFHHQMTSCKYLKLLLQFSLQWPLRCMCTSFFVLILWTMLAEHNLDIFMFRLPSIPFLHILLPLWGQWP